MMEKKIKDGGPAFPLVDKNIGYHADIVETASRLSVHSYSFQYAALCFIWFSLPRRGYRRDPRRTIHE
jgi:hypothetical protein